MFCNTTLKAGKPCLLLSVCLLILPLRPIRSRWFRSRW
nr:MAG TPA: hypothetical protein [Caudoviricetes sp.]